VTFCCLIVSLEMILSIFNAHNACFVDSLCMSDLCYFMHSNFVVVICCNMREHYSYMVSSETGYILSAEFFEGQTDLGA
jgi:hypothetical protein